MAQHETAYISEVDATECTSSKENLHTLLEKCNEQDEVAEQLWDNSTK